MPQQPPTILLLKTRSTPEDKYDALFRSKDFSPEFVPVLTHHFHSDALSSIHHLFTSGALPPGPNRRYGGLIFTSQRAVEGFRGVLEGIEPSLVQQASKSLKIYTVGPATASALTSLKTSYLPDAEVIGGECGNGDCLADVILSHYNSLPHHLTHSHTDPAEGSNGEKYPLLFLTGEQHRDVIPKKLMSESLPEGQRIVVEERIVYDTGIREGFGEVFRDSLNRLFTLPEGADGAAVWVAVFSPSGCESMVSVLDELGLRTGTKKVYVATIGSTTRDHLRKFGFEADVCAEKPSPEGLWDGIRGVMES